MRYCIVLVVGGIVLSVSSALSFGQSLGISIGIRETGSTAAIGADGGTANGIEFVNLDGQSLPMDGNWHLFTFNFQNDPLTAFAGTTANSLYDGTRGTLEHLRIRNTSGVTTPITVWVDEIVNTLATGGATSVENFDSFAAGTEVVFQEPNFSGSTAANLVAGGTAAVTDSVAFAGPNSYEMNFQFVDGTDTRWVRGTTFGTANKPNPTIDFANGSSLTFRMRAAPIPEPASLSILGMAAAMTLVRTRRN